MVMRVWLRTFSEEMTETGDEDGDSGFVWFGSDCLTNMFLKETETITF